MFWETLWALVLGFGLSGAVQAFVSRSKMEQVLGRSGPREIARASLLGAASSSCSYAASAMAKTLFQRGADFISSMVFMFASTNLVVELGIVLWVLIGWQFALAEFVGGAIMIVLFSLAARLVLARREIDEAARAGLGAAGRREPRGESRPRPASTAGWADAAATRSAMRRCCGRNGGRVRRRRLPRRPRPDELLEQRLRHRARLLDVLENVVARAVPRDHQLRLLGRERAPGGGPVAGRHQLRRRRSASSSPT